jgi:hypothetical protein
MPEQDPCEDAEQPAQDGGDQHDPDHRLPVDPTTQLTSTVRRSARSSATITTKSATTSRPG